MAKVRKVQGGRILSQGTVCVISDSETQLSMANLHLLCTSDLCSSPALFSPQLFHKSNLAQQRCWPAAAVRPIFLDRPVLPSITHTPTRRWDMSVLPYPQRCPATPDAPELPGIPSTIITLLPRPVLHMPTIWQSGILSPRSANAALVPSSAPLPLPQCTHQHLSPSNSCMQLAPTMGCSCQYGGQRPSSLCIPVLVLSRQFGSLHYRSRQRPRMATGVRGCRSKCQPTSRQVHCTSSSCNVNDSSGWAPELAIQVSYSMGVSQTTARSLPGN